MKKSWVRSVVVLWAVWAVVILGFQGLAAARVTLKRPDTVLSWTANETARNSQNGKPYLLEPFLNQQVSWDSEYYLSIAVGGYEDPVMRRVTTPDGERISQNYAFFGFYSLLIRVVMLPFGLLGLTSIATATLAGVLVSLLGTLAGCLALYDLCREVGGLRAVFYLLVFPSGFFLAQVYTEGVFVGLAFTALALLDRQRWGWAALLSMAAIWARPVGVALLLAFGAAWWQWRAAHAGDWRGGLVRAVWVLIPVAAFWGWRFSIYGEGFFAVEEAFFSRQTLAVLDTVAAWSNALRVFASNNLPGKVYYAIELGSLLIGVVGSLSMLRRYPILGWFGLGVIGIAFFSAVPQSMARYMLVVPGIYLLLARWGRNEIVDRAWSIISILLLGLSAILFTFDMWAG